jgi:short subunit dehydrogenase-like uncharacterized protein
MILSGRDRAKLEAVAQGIGGAAEVAAVPLDDEAALNELIDRAAVVIGCAGPFTLHGRPLIEAAARGGVRYLDTTGEQPFIRESFERWGAEAEARGAALVSGMGFDYAPGDMLAALVADGIGPIDEMTLAYTIRGFTPTRGTTLSALEMMRGGDVELRDGELVPAARSVGRGRFEFPSPIGSRRVGRYMSGEQITVPRHVDVRTLRTVIDLRSLLPLPTPVEALSAGLLNAGGRAMGTPLRGALGKLVAHLPDGPEEEHRRAVRFTIACEARAGSRTRSGVVRGSDVYGTTAVMLAHGAIRMAAEDYSPRGALAPAQAFEPRDFLEALEPFGLTFDAGEPS